MSKRRHSLVCQHMEMVSRKAIEEYQGILKQFVKRRHGIYALYRKSRLCYVGLASNLRSRLNHHLRDRHAKTWDRFSIYLTLDQSHLRELEALTIRIAAPKGNRQKGKFSLSENLLPIFRKQIRERLKSELRNLFEVGKRAVPKVVGNKFEGRRPVLAGYFPSGKKLRLAYKGKVYRAYVKRDGHIRFKGKLYTSPSVAAIAATKTLAKNGWSWWKYERAPGDWILLDELRK